MDQVILVGGQTLPGAVIKTRLRPRPVVAQVKSPIGIQRKVFARRVGVIRTAIETGHHDRHVTALVHPAKTVGYRMYLRDLFTASRHGSARNG